MNGNIHAGFASSGWGSSPVRKLAASASSDWNVILHPDLSVIEQIQQTVTDWLAQIGLELKPSKTRITHTFHSHQGAIGFDFLGFHTISSRSPKVVKTVTSTGNYFTLIVIITRLLKKTSGFVLAVLVTKAKQLRSGVTRKFHAPF